MDSNHDAETRIPLQMKVGSQQNDMNIPNDDSHSEGGSSGNNADSPNVVQHKRYRRTYKRVCASVPYIFSVVAVVLAIIAISFYSKTASELATARENRGKCRMN